jgi:hypothetical protein
MILNYPPKCHIGDRDGYRIPGKEATLRSPSLVVMQGTSRRPALAAALPMNQPRAIVLNASCGSRFVLHFSEKGATAECWK